LHGADANSSDSAARAFYNPSINASTFAGYMRENHGGPSATLLTKGKVLVAGGVSAIAAAVGQQKWVRPENQLN
jgi:hypothetical protein